MKRCKKFLVSVFYSAPHYALTPIMMSQNISNEQLQKIIAYANSFDTDRYTKWVNVSIKLAAFDTFMVVTVQGLGKLDAKLIKEDEAIIQNGSSSSPFGDISDHLTLSYLWVLGAYEIIRSLDQRTRSNTGFFPNYRESLRQLKWDFERIRIPLAKFEPAKKHKDTDSHIAYPWLNTALGVAWQVSEDTWITRRELSDSMLNIFESLGA